MHPQSRILHDRVAFFKSKHSFSTLGPRFLKGLEAICNIHEFGRVKYAAYSWQSDPFKSFSTIDVNLDAILRHLTLFKAGFDMDIDKYPHLYAIACRSGMLIGTWYHGMLYGTQLNPRIDNFSKLSEYSELYNEHTHDDFEFDINNTIKLAQVSPYHIISLSKTYGNESLLFSLDKILEPYLEHANTKKKRLKNFYAAIELQADAIEMLYMYLSSRYDQSNYRSILPKKYQDYKNLENVDYIIQEINPIDLLFYHATTLIYLVWYFRNDHDLYLTDEKLSEVLNSARQRY